MVIVDANVLLYAVDSASAHHGEALAWLDSSLAGAEAVGLAWVALLAIVRISTNPAAFPTPATADDAPTQRERCAASGMDGFLSKPLQLGRLRAELRRVTLL